MRKQILTLKTLLTAAVLCVGSLSAWADEATLNPLATTQLHAGEATTVKYNAEATSWTCTVSSVTSNTFKNDNKTYGGSYVVITKFDASSTLSGKTLTSAKLTFNTICTVSGKNSAVRVWSIGTNWTASTATWDNTNTTEIINGSVIHTTENVGTTSASIEVNVLDLVNSDDDKVIGFGFSTVTAREQSISNIQLVLTYADPSSATTYAIEKYTVDGNLISSEEDIAGIVGETASAATSQATFFSADGNTKYIYDAENAKNVVSKELVADAASNVLKLYFNSYAKQTCTVKATDGESELGTVASGTFYSDESSKTLYWSKFVQFNSVWYETEADPTTYYSHTFTATGEYTVTYTARPDVIYFAEWNNICVRTYNNWNGEKASGGNATILANSTNSTNAAATTGIITGGQTVDIYVSGYCRSGASTTKTFYLANGESNTEIGNMTFTNSAFNTQVIENVRIETDASIKTIVASGNDYMVGDYIYVKISNYPATITSAGWATLYTPYALDFSGIDGLTAYTATLDGETVILTAVNDVPANTGVVLKGTEGS